jgi:hypothetical protein
VLLLEAFIPGPATAECAGRHGHAGLLLVGDGWHASANSIEAKTGTTMKHHLGGQVVGPHYMPDKGITDVVTGVLSLASCSPNRPDQVSSCCAQYKVAKCSRGFGVFCAVGTDGMTSSRASAYGSWQTNLAYCTQ